MTKNRRKQFIRTSGKALISGIRLREANKNFTNNSQTIFLAFCKQSFRIPWEFREVLVDIAEVGPLHFDMYCNSKMKVISLEGRHLTVH